MSIILLYLCWIRPILLKFHKIPVTSATNTPGRSTPEAHDASHLLTPIADSKRWTKLWRNTFL